MGPLSRLDPNVITDGTLITLGFKYIHLGHLSRLGPNFLADGTFITLGSIHYTCAFYKVLLQFQ